MLAQRSEIAQQALSELNQLSSYRPSAVDRRSGSLTRRVPAAVPPVRPAPEPAQRHGGPEDAEHAASVISQFRAGASRGRRVADAPPDAPSAASRQSRGAHRAGPLDPEAPVDQDSYDASPHHG